MYVMDGVAITAGEGMATGIGAGATAAAGEADMAGADMAGADMGGSLQSVKD
jgi:hypothetical protein